MTLSGTSTHRYCWMPARASMRSRSISGIATPASPGGPTHPPAADQRTANRAGRWLRAHGYCSSVGRRPAHGPRGAS